MRVNQDLKLRRVLSEALTPTEQLIRALYDAYLIQDPTAYLGLVNVSSLLLASPGSGGVKIYNNKLPTPVLIWMQAQPPGSDIGCYLFWSSAQSSVGPGKGAYAWGPAATGKAVVRPGESLFVDLVTPIAGAQNVLWASFNLNGGLAVQVEDSLLQINRIAGP